MISKKFHFDLDQADVVAQSVLKIEYNDHAECAGTYQANRPHKLDTAENAGDNWKARMTHKTSLHLKTFHCTLLAIK